DVIRYSKLFPTDSVNVDSLANCDTVGMTDLFGQIKFKLGPIVDSCQFRGGAPAPICPDNVYVSRGSKRVVVEYIEGVFSSPPDSVVLGDTVYYSQGYNQSHPNTIIYLIDSAVVCDTADMSIVLNDTLFLGEKACVYESGLLPIFVLAFDYTSTDNGIELTWKVNSDEPTQRLYLQKSYDGVDWTNVFDQTME